MWSNDNILNIVQETYNILTGVIFQVIAQRTFTAMKKIIVVKNAIEFIIYPFSIFTY